ncbi:hypothetical protein D3C87_1754140 [compost metagenome]
MGRHHDGRARLQAGFDGRYRRTDAGVFRDLAGIVLRHVQIGADKHALAGEIALGDEIGETQDRGHGE